MYSHILPNGGVISVQVVLLSTYIVCLCSVVFFSDKKNDEVLAIVYLLKALSVPMDCYHLGPRCADEP